MGVVEISVTLSYPVDDQLFEFWGEGVGGCPSGVAVDNALGPEELHPFLDALYLSFGEAQGVGALLIGHLVIEHCFDYSVPCGLFHGKCHLSFHRAPH